MKFLFLWGLCRGCGLCALGCPYAFDFIKQDWESILKNHNFGNFEEHFFFKDYVRLLKAKKL